MKRKHVLYLILIFCCILYGCSQKASEDTSNRLKGRYIEKNLSLPAEAANASLQLTKKDQKPFLYSYSETPFAITGYQLEDDGSWTEATPAWLQALPSLPRGWTYRPQVMEATNGYQYLFYYELIDNDMKANLICSKDGTTYEVLHPEGWDERDPASGSYTFPSMVALLEDGTLAALNYSGEVNLYDSADQKLSYTLSEYRYSTDFLFSSGTKLILGEQDDNNRIKSMVVYDTSLSDSSNYPFESTLESSMYADYNGKDLLLCNADGIFKLEENTSLWNCVLDGTLTSLAMPTMWSTGFVADASGNYYVLFQSDTGNSMMQYTFDETVDTSPSNELNIYSLTDNSTLRQAAAIFQQTHTDVRVNFTIAMSKEEYASADAAVKEDYIRALNTELLAGSNYDILVLDGLPADSLIEKGVLTDLGGLLQPMIDDGTLYKNIMDNYRGEGGSIYRIPARFGVNMLFGTNGDVNRLNTLEALAEYASATNTPMFGSLTLDDLIDLFLPYEINSLLSPDGKISKDNLLQTLQALKLVGDRCQILESYDNATVRGNNVWNLPSGEYLALSTSKSFLDSIFPFGMTKHVKGSYTSFENSFSPSCELGISTKSTQPELGQEFLLTVLSEEVQKNDLYDGFPINSKAMAAGALLDRSNYSVGTSITNDGGSSTFLALEAPDQQQIEDLVRICSSVTNRVLSDDHIAAAIKENAGEFFTGTLSAEAAADAVIEKLNVYLSE